MNSLRNLQAKEIVKVTAAAEIRNSLCELAAAFATDEEDIDHKGAFEAFSKRYAKAYSFMKRQDLLIRGLYPSPEQLNAAIGDLRGAMDIVNKVGDFRAERLAQLVGAIPEASFRFSFNDNHFTGPPVDQLCPALILTRAQLMTRHLTHLREEHPILKSDGYAQDELNHIYNLLNQYHGIIIDDATVKFIQLTARANDLARLEKEQRRGR